MTISKHLKTIFGALLFICALFQNGDSKASCLIQYDDEFALSNTFDQARNQFSSKTRYNSAMGRLEPCLITSHIPANRGQWQFWDNMYACWNYRERCGYTNYYVNQWPEGAQSHFHMDFRNPFMTPLCGCDPEDYWSQWHHMTGYGFFVNGTCYDDASTCPDWGNSPRTGSTAHSYRDWTVVYVEKGSDSIEHPFTLYDITIGPIPAEIWWRKTDGSVWGHSYLGTGYHVLNATDITRFRIRTAPSVAPAGPTRMIDYIILTPDSGF